MASFWRKIADRVEANMKKPGTLTNRFAERIASIPLAQKMFTVMDKHI